MILRNDRHPKGKEMGPAKGRVINKRPYDARPVFTLANAIPSARIGEIPTGGQKHSWKATNLKYASNPNKHEVR